MTVQFSSFIVGDIDGIAAFISLDNLDAAARFYTAFDNTIDLLRRMPGIRTKVEPPIRSLPGLRVVTLNKFKAYLLFYQSKDGVLRIVRVVHHARDRDSLFRDEI